MKFSRYYNGAFDPNIILKSRPLYFYLVSHPEKYEIVMSDESAVYFRVINEPESETLYEKNGWTP